MNPELQKQLAEMLAKLTVFAGDAATFAKDQIPPLVQEKITMGRWEETTWEVLCLAVGLTMIAAGIRYWKLSWRTVVSTDGDAPVILLNIAAIATGAIISYPTHNLFLVWFAPRLYIVEWLKEMVTK